MLLVSTEAPDPDYCGLSLNTVLFSFHCILTNIINKNHSRSDRKHYGNVRKPELCSVDLTYECLGFSFSVFFRDLLVH